MLRQIEPANLSAHCSVRSFRFSARWATASAIAVVAAVVFGASCIGTDKVTTQQLLVQERACVENIQKGDYVRAETRCELCLEYSSRSAECLNGLGLIFYVRGEEERARDYYKKAIRENNDFAQAWNNLGVLEFVKKDFETAAYNFEKSIEIDPGYLDGRYNLALVHLRMAERRRASAYANETQAAANSGKAVDPNAIWFNIGDGDRAYIKEHYDKAEVEYRKIFELFPQHTDSYRDMGLMMTYRAQLEKVENKRQEWISDAETFLIRCLDLDPQREECHESVGHLFLAVGRYDESLFHFIQCLSVNKNNPVCRSELKIAYGGSQLKGEALQEYVNQLAENPGYAPGHYGFCIALFDRGLTDMAVTECENALKLDETICLANFQLAVHYKNALDKDLALENARGLLSCAKEDARYADEIAQAKEIITALEVQ